MMERNSPIDSESADDAAAGFPEESEIMDAEAAETDTGAAEDASEQAAEDPLAAALAERDRWRDTALRARADLDNYRKRIATEKSEAIRYANQSLFESLLPVLDNFHFGIEAARTATDAGGVLLGMEMVLKQFEDFLANQNITEVPAEEGSPFDPNLHEAMAQEHDPEAPEGSILKVIRRGYRMGDRLVRAANVVVSKGPE